jgi:hypothetical protein
MTTRRIVTGVSLVLIIVLTMSGSTLAQVCSGIFSSLRQSSTQSCVTGPVDGVTWTEGHDVWGLFACTNGANGGSLGTQNVTTSGTGGCGWNNPGPLACPPVFNAPSITLSGWTHVWTQTVNNNAFFPVAPSSGWCYGQGSTNYQAYFGAINCNGPTCHFNCEPAPGQCRDDQQWSYLSCQCETVCPIVIDRSGNGLTLTNAEAGVEFDFNPGGAKEFLSWTAQGSDDGFLVLDRNGNGYIDNGAELFGSYAPQPERPRKNGFEALAVFDSAGEGGNGDGKISSSDAIFPRLQVWTDLNHDGVSTDEELVPLSTTELTAISLNYKGSRRRDEHGNLLRYRSKAEGGAAKWIWDVVFVYR